MSRRHKRRRYERREPLRDDPLQRQLAGVLDSLNALGFLEALRAPSTLLSFGPKVARGGRWMGAVRWYRRPGYHNYQTLNLLGIWAQAAHDEEKQAPSVEVIVGTRTLHYNADFYNAESYFHHIQHTFETYYGNDAGPPPGAARLYAARYDAARRLDMRRAIETALKQWVSMHRPGYTS